MRPLSLHVTQGIMWDERVDLQIVNRQNSWLINMIKMKTNYESEFD